MSFRHIETAIRAFRSVAMHGSEITEIRVSDDSWCRMVIEGHDTCVQIGLLSDEPIAHLTYCGIRILPKTHGLAFDPVRGRKVRPGEPKGRRRRVR